ncbi:hypothetical protein TKK_0012228 [Trichogramma kaykai]
MQNREVLESKALAANLQLEKSKKGKNGKKFNKNKNIKCYYCHKPGHKKYYCREKESNKNFSETKKTFGQAVPLAQEFWVRLAALDRGMVEISHKFETRFTKHGKTIIIGKRKHEISKLFIMQI